MDLSTKVSLATSFFGAVSAVGTLAAAWAAWKSVASWRLGLQQQRADECITAINDCAAAVGRTLTMMKKTQNLGNQIDAAWDCWTRFRSAYAVSRRYNRNLPVKILSDGQYLLHQHANVAYGRPSSEDENLINKKFDDLVKKVEACLSER